ncbi:hypothetical protein DH2020_003820 [Rehmannia glutinosa]|uniref:BAG domain-containing protein n=1 Tax=Rehmannia glutinosa TaxID=99300 RepID=A0ABR0XMP8_REHGL
MESAFFRNGRWYQQPGPTRHHFSHSPSFGGGLPVYQVDPSMGAHRPVRPTQRPPDRNPGPKVVRIPVHFVGSEQVDRSGSALKIQKVFRGFLVRKCLKKIKDIKVQVDEIEERLLKSEVVELVRRDEKERLRMNESLMSLLFKLDSICGVDFGVRGCRKAVIRKAIALQERIDAILTTDFKSNVETVDQEPEIGQTVSNETTDSSNVTDDPVKPKDSFETAGNLEPCFEFPEILEDASCVRGGDNNKMEVEGNEGEVDVIDVGVDREVKVSDVVAVKERLNERDEKDKNGDEAEGDNKQGKLKLKGGNDNERNRDLLERMLEDNEKMMRLMIQLFERNEIQTRMLNALTNRVEMLEKAYASTKEASVETSTKHASVEISKKKQSLKCRSEALVKETPADTLMKETPGETLMDEALVETSNKEASVEMSMKEPLAEISMKETVVGSLTNEALVDTSTKGKVEEKQVIPDKDVGDIRDTRLSKVAGIKKNFSEGNQ